MKFKPKGSGSGVDGKDVLKLKDGEKVKGVFRGEPRESNIHWIGSTPNTCPEDATCAHCQQGTNKRKFRFQVNFLINENGAYVAKVVEQGWKMYNDLRDLQDSGYVLEETIIQISRTGLDKNNTRYALIPSPNGAVTPAMKKKLDAVQLIPLGERPVAVTAPEPEEEPEVGSTEDDTPF